MHAPTTNGESSFERELNAHAAMLARSGLGEISEMSKRSLLETMMARGDLPTVHAVEGEKFSAMAERIAPPKLVAEFIKKMSDGYPSVIILPEEKAIGTFRKLLARTNPSQETLTDEARKKGGDFQYKPSETISYINRCMQNPALQLSLLYYSIALQMFVAEVASKMKSQGMGDDMYNFGKQFNSSNLVTEIPIAIHICHGRIHGSNAMNTPIDQKTINEAMDFLHVTERFAIRANNRETGRGVSLQCPMERYLRELFITQEGLLPLIRSTEKLHSDCLATPADQDPGNETMLNHTINSVTVMESINTIVGSKSR